jgi:transglutaminase-like putative cysteine protease
MSELTPFLAGSEWIDVLHPLVQAQAQTLAQAVADASAHSLKGSGHALPLDHALIQACFEFVRDEIAHSGDAGHGPVTCRASEVLAHRTGFCYAKSHLLAALLRANGIPAALCYQRLSVGEQGPPHCLHGLNAVWLSGLGWYRLDARGNKPGVDALFKPPIEVLAFAVRGPQEWDLPGRHAEPMACVVEALQRWHQVPDLLTQLPDAPSAQA